MNNLSDQQIVAVQDILIEELGIKREQLATEARLMEDLGADSIESVEIAMRVEDQFGITIPDEEMERIVNVGDLLEILGEKLNRSVQSGAK